MVGRESHSGAHGSRGRAGRALERAVEKIWGCLGWRLVLLLGASLIVVFSLASFVGLHFHRNYLTQQLEDQAVGVAGTLFQATWAAMLENDQESLRQITQNVTNMLDHGMDIEESTNHPRFGNAYSAGGGMFLAVEADFPQDTLEAANARGLDAQVVNPYNFGMGSFEGIWIDPETGVIHAAGDPAATRHAGALDGP